MTVRDQEELKTTDLGADRTIRDLSRISLDLPPVFIVRDS